MCRVSMIAHLQPEARTVFGAAAAARPATTTTTITTTRTRGGLRLN